MQQINLIKSNFGYFDDSRLWTVIGEEPSNLHLLIDCHEDMIRGFSKPNQASVYVLSFYGFSNLHIKNELPRGLNNFEIENQIFYLPKKENNLLNLKFNSIQLVYLGLLDLQSSELGYDFYLPSKIDFSKFKDIIPNLDEKILIL